MKCLWGPYSQASTHTPTNIKEDPPLGCQQEPSVQPGILPPPDNNKVELLRPDGCKSSLILCGTVSRKTANTENLK